MARLLELLPNEEVKKVLRPHPLSFTKYWIIVMGIWISAILLAWIFTTSQWADFERWFEEYSSEKRAVMFVFSDVLLALWAILGFALFFSWRRQWIFWLPVLIVGNGLIALLDAPPHEVSVAYLIATGALSMLYIESERRSYTYHLTTHRIVFNRALASAYEREIRVEHIRDLITMQGWLGRIFNFGTLVPITSSQLGSGEELKMLMGGPGLKGPLGRVSISVKAATARSKKTSVDDPALVLFGVPRPTEVKTEISLLVDGSSQVAELRRIRSVLADGKVEGGGTDNAKPHLAPSTRTGGDVK